MTLLIRRATADDTQVAIGLEPTPSLALAAILRQAFAGDHGHVAYLAEVEGRPVGYAIVGRFFGHPFLQRLRTAGDWLRQGVASALMDEVEAQADGDRLFISTNESNTIMRTLLAKRDYKVSGLVENLDPGDPELFFVKFAPAPKPA